MRMRGARSTVRGVCVRACTVFARVQFSIEKDDWFEKSWFEKSWQYMFCQLCVAMRCSYPSVY